MRVGFENMCIIYHQGYVRIHNSHSGTRSKSSDTTTPRHYDDDDDEE